MRQGTTRRDLLRLLPGVPLTVLPGAPVLAGHSAAGARKTALISRLIDDARSLPRVAERIDFISARYIGVRYQANTLIGGPRHPEVFVVRDDAFDCVTFCEVVLAAALARDLPEFEMALLRIRYRHAQVRWEARNHYFAEWSRRIVENGICRPVAMAPSITIDKEVNWKNLGRRQVSISAIPKATFWANRALLQRGDVIGFVSGRSNLDFYHTGLITFDGRGEPLLRHASRSRGRILDDSLQGFFAANGVRYVTLLRAVEDEPRRAA
jgi:hypothetical protein